MAETEQKLRVRFAPSPTGHLHVGGARTALYNWLLARGQSGTFILRLEDTDLSRSTDEAVAQIISSMRWLGLDWDEGPDEGGPFGPYRQMERTDLYREAAERLIAAGQAYWCFCTGEELAAEREQARSSGKAYVYSGKCLGLGNEVVDRCLAEGQKPVIRLKAPRGGATVVHDLIHGDVSFENELIGDIILVRSSGVPTYNFAVAVDDAAMQVSLVVRGDDHLPNTPKQMLVLAALGHTAPVYAHVPLILGPDKAPLSKRHGSASLEEFRAQGYLREAMCNFLALLGWSYDGETTIFSIEELIARFSLERVGSTPAVFDRDKLLWMNGYYIRTMDPHELAARIEQFLAGHEILSLAGKDSRPQIKDLIPLVQEKIKTLAEFAPMTDFFFLPVTFEEKAVAKLKADPAASEILGRAATELACVEPYDVETIEASLRAAADGMGLKLGKFLQPIRIAVSGKTVTPGMFETLALLGREKCIRRINRAMELLEEG